MATTPERRRVVPLPIPSLISGPRTEGFKVRLLDLSPEGARIEHIRLFPKWNMCVLDLPLDLGEIRLQGRVIWSQVAGQKEVAEGGRVVFYQSRLRFTMLTPGQQERLTAALELLKAAQEG